MKKKYSMCIALLALASASLAQSCPPSLNLTASVVQGSSTEQAQHHLTSSSYIKAGSVEYRAGKSISLTPGFEALPGAVFQASITPCVVDGLPDQANTEELLSLKVYPNPFSDNAQIEYSLPEENLVNLYITDIRGVVVKRLLANEKIPQGIHQLYFDGSYLSAGAYLFIVATAKDQKSLRVVKE